MHVGIKVSKYSWNDFINTKKASGWKKNELQNMDIKYKVELYLFKSVKQFKPQEDEVINWQELFSRENIWF